MPSLPCGWSLPPRAITAGRESLLELNTVVFYLEQFIRIKKSQNYDQSWIRKIILMYSRHGRTTNFCESHTELNYVRVSTSICSVLIGCISPDVSKKILLIYQLYSMSCINYILSVNKNYISLKKRFSVVLVLPKVLNPCISPTWAQRVEFKGGITNYPQSVDRAPGARDLTVTTVGERNTVDA